jgi:hypothetical protein
MNQVHDAPFEWCIDLSLPVVPHDFFRVSVPALLLFNETKNLAYGFMESVGRHCAAGRLLSISR